MLETRHISYPGGVVFLDVERVQSHDSWLGCEYYAVGVARARFLLPHGPSMRLRQQGMLDAWMRREGFREYEDIEIGKAAFDASYIVEGDAREAVVRVLGRGQSCLSRFQKHVQLVESDGTDLFGVGALLALPDAAAIWPDAGPPVVTSSACLDVQYTVETGAEYGPHTVLRYSGPAVDAVAVHGAVRRAFIETSRVYRFFGICEDQAELIEAGELLRSLDRGGTPYR